jgi:hypothetical protein
MSCDETKEFQKTLKPKVVVGIRLSIGEMRSEDATA